MNLHRVLDDAAVAARHRDRDRNAARAAALRIRERAERLKLGQFDWDEWKAYRDEGRK